MYGAKARYQDTSIAEAYDDRFQSIPGRLGQYLSMRSLRKAVEACPANSVFLDIPCGTGRLTMELAHLGFKVVAADVSKEMIQVAQKKDYSGNVLKWVQSDAENLPFADAEFDCLTSGRFLAHLPSDVRVKVLTEFARVTKKRLIVGYHIRNSLADWSRYIRTKGHVKSFNLSRVTMGEARQEFEAAGLREIQSLTLLPVLHDYKYFILEKK